MPIKAIIPRHKAIGLQFIIILVMVCTYLSIKRDVNYAKKEKALLGLILPMFEICPEFSDARHHIVVKQDIHERALDDVQYIKYHNQSRVIHPKCTPCFAKRLIRLHIITSV